MAKLFVIQARDVPLGVILRRGPSKWYHIIAWNTRTDKMEHGAWFKGRIYEDRCDLSPDGELFLYFVLKAGYRKMDLPDSWTALSRPPWLKALTIWPLGDTYGGGGRFTADRKVALRQDDVCHPLLKNTCVKVDRKTQAEYHRSAEIVPVADWSGLDFDGHTVFTVKGKLFRIKKGRTLQMEIADFTDLRPDPQPAPEWAAAPSKPAAKNETAGDSLSGT